jgi:putative oxidoreductase
MKIASTIARYLLGLMFTVFGLNGFLSFIPQPPPVNPLAIQFFVAISASHFATSFFAVQVVGGLLLLSGFFVPLALTLLAAVLYNILAFHLTLAGHRSGAGCLCPLDPGLCSVPGQLQRHLRCEASSTTISASQHERWKCLSYCGVSSHGFSCVCTSRTAGFNIAHPQRGSASRK